MIALAVPGSATFAGEFLIMAGVYGQGWGYSVVVALGVVLAAMYTLRVISAILHVKPGRAVRDEALDLRLGELALVLPLLLVLIGLSVWPALVSESCVRRATRTIAEIVAVIDTPTVDWLALSPTIALLVARGHRAPVRAPPGLDAKGRRRERGDSPAFVVAAVLAGYVFHAERDARDRCSTGRWCATSSPPWRR